MKARVWVSVILVGALLSVSCETTQVASKRRRLAARKLQPLTVSWTWLGGRANVHACVNHPTQPIVFALVSFLQENGQRFFGIAKIVGDPKKTSARWQPLLPVGNMAGVLGSLSPVLRGHRWVPELLIDVNDSRRIVFKTKGSVFRSIDGGALWQELPVPDGVSSNDYVGVALDQTRSPSDLYANVGNRDEGVRLFQYDPQGNAWTAIDHTPPGRLFIDGEGRFLIFDRVPTVAVKHNSRAPEYEEVLQKHGEPLGFVPHIDVIYQITGAKGVTLAAVGRHGVFERVLGTKQWQRITPRQNRGGFYRVAVDRHPPHLFLGATRSMPAAESVGETGGAALGVFMSQDQGNTWRGVGLEGQDIRCLTLDASRGSARPSRVVVGSSRGLVVGTVQKQ